ncbi:hypothetical protein [Haloplanus rubicundus]|jgi:hypothetical protein|nr:hypothetical protein [Haloplanus rubicundus]
MTEVVAMTFAEEVAAGWFVMTGSFLIVAYHLARYAQRRRGY